MSIQWKLLARCGLGQPHLLSPYFSSAGIFPFLATLLPDVTPIFFLVWSVSRTFLSSRLHFPVVRCQGRFFRIAQSGFYGLHRSARGQFILFPLVFSFPTARVGASPSWDLFVSFWFPWSTQHTLTTGSLFHFSVLFSLLFFFFSTIFT